MVTPSVLQFFFCHCLSSVVQKLFSWSSILFRQNCSINMCNLVCSMEVVSSGSCYITIWTRTILATLNILQQEKENMLLFIFLKCILILREKERKQALWERERKRERGRERGRKRIPSRLCADSIGRKLMNCEIIAWAKIKSWMLNQLSHSGAPRKYLYKA